MFRKHPGDGPTCALSHTESPVKRFARTLIRRRRLVLITAALLCLASLLMLSGVRVNYDLSSYLPDDAPSAQALWNLGAQVPNLQAYVPGLSIPDALAAKTRLKGIAHVREVLWLDDVTDPRGIPPEMIPSESLDRFYANGGALFEVTVDITRSAEVLKAAKEAFPEAIFRGEAANQARTQTVSMSEISSIMVYVLPLVLLVLLLSTKHWFEPLLFLMVIGLAILLNEGTNLFLGSVSFITRACSAALQLAVSIDYAVFLLHRFGECRAEGMEAVEAMTEAMKRAAPSVAASAMTTVAGFLALILTDFRLGADMGIVLAKGVLLSWLSVMVVLPAAAVSCMKLIDRTAHRSLLPSFNRFGAGVIRRGVPLTVVLLVLLLPAWLGQARNDFVYGSAGMHDPASAARQEADAIGAMFSDDQLVLIMVPQGDAARSAELARELGGLPFASQVLSYAGSVGAEIPPQMLPEQARSQFLSGGWERIILYADTPSEGQQAFAAVEAVRAVTEKHFGKGCHIVGESVVNYDLMKTITGDNAKILLGGAAAISLILMITFRNLAVPVILLLVIEGSIWLNMSVPYFTGAQMNYIGYQIISSVQLGATVDYGILLVQRYIESRKILDRKNAAARALALSAGSILPPALILTAAGYTLGAAVKSNAVISQMGVIIGRGAAISAVMVLLALPHILLWCDPLIVRWKKREGRKLKTAKKAAATLVALALLCGPTLSKAEVLKEEVVYARLSADGEAAQVFVVNAFESDGAAEVLDYGPYAAVSNLSDTRPLDFEGNCVRFSMEAGRFYYQGVPAQPKLPWTISIVYLLDGRETDPAELPGASGELTLRIGIAAEPELAEHASGVTLQLTVTLDGDRCAGIRADKATIAAAGGNRMVSFTLLPGMDAAFEVTAAVRDFSMADIQIAGVRMTADADMYRRMASKSLEGSPLAGVAGNMMESFLAGMEASPPLSFADPRNGVIQSVQYVFLADGIPEKARDAASAPQETQEESVWTRFLQLFGG